jgi:hypothetical protein
MARKRFTVKQMKAALLRVSESMNEGQLLMLKGHYSCRTASMGEIAKFASYKNFGAANIQYGKLGRMIANEIGFRLDGFNCTYTIATIAERDKKGHIQWQLDDVVAVALEELHWVNRSRK